MKAAQFDNYGEPEVLHIAEVPIPEPGPGQVRVRVKATSVNPIDWKIRSGRVTAIKQFPAGTGWDASGVVDVLGEGVTGVQPGDQVFGLVADKAGAAEYAILGHWATKPAGMSWEQAATLPLATETGERVLRLAGVQPGETILVDGASGAVGVALVQFARQVHHLTVIGTSSEGNFDFLRSLGVHPVTYGPGLAERVAEFGRIDRVIDLSGRMIPELIQIAGDPDRLSTVVHNDFSDTGGFRETHSSPTEGAFDALQLAADLFEDGRFVINVGDTGPLEEIARLHSLNEAGQGGKIVVVVDPTE